MVRAYECFAALLTRMAGDADIAGMLLRGSPGNAPATWGVTTMAIHLEFALDSGIGECAISLYGTLFGGYVQPSPSARGVGGPRLLHWDGLPRHGRDRADMYIRHRRGGGPVSA
jgi:hypothetical protein